jgi:hypothetical protein
MFTWGIKLGLVPGPNPVSGCGRTKAAEALDYLSRDEVARLLAHAAEHAPPVYPMHLWYRASRMKPTKLRDALTRRQAGVGPRKGDRGVMRGYDLLDKRFGLLVGEQLAFDLAVRP